MSIVKMEYDLITEAGIESVDNAQEMYQQVADWVNSNLSDYFTASVYNKSGTTYGIRLADRTGIGGVSLCHDDYPHIYYIDNNKVTTSNAGVSAKVGLDTLRLVIYSVGNGYMYGWRYAVNNTLWLKNICECVDDSWRHIICTSIPTYVIADDKTKVHYSYSLPQCSSNITDFSMYPILAPYGVSKYIWCGNGLYINQGTEYTVDNFKCVNSFRANTAQSFLVLADGI